MATMKDVARLAGVSVATVSCALSGAKNVHPETRTRIMQAIEKLNYVPNMAAQELRLTKAKKVGVIMPDFSEGFFADIYKCALTVLQSEGYSVKISFSYWDEKSEREQIEMFLHEKVSGLLIVTCQPENELYFRKTFQNIEAPVIFIQNRPMAVYEAFVGCDTYEIAKTMADKLLEEAVTNLFVVMGGLQYSAECDFFEGVCAAYREAGKEFPLGNRYITNMTKEDAFKATMLACNQAKTRTGFLCTSTQAARGVYEALRIQGLRIPEDCIVFALGEEHWNRSEYLPGVIYSARAAEDLGKLAAEQLLQFLRGDVPEKGGRCILLKDHLLDDPIHVPKAAPNVAQAKPKDTIRLLCIKQPSVYALQLLMPVFTVQTGIEVQFEIINDSQQLLAEIQREASSPSDRFDAAMFDLPWASHLAYENALMDIQAWRERPDFPAEQIMKYNWDTMNCEGKCIGLPIIDGAQTLFYRRDLFENPSIMRAYYQRYNMRLQLPRTWLEYNRIAEFFTREYNPDSPTLYGTALAGDHDGNLIFESISRFWSKGGRLWNEAGKPSLDTVQNERAMDFVMSVYKYTRDYTYEKEYQGAIESFCRGEVAMIIAFNELANGIRNSLNRKIIGSIGYTLPPGDTCIQAGWGLGVSPHSKKLDCVYQLFKWLCQKDTNLYYAISGGISTAAAPYQNSAILSLYPWLSLRNSGAERRYSRIMPPQQYGKPPVPCEKIEQIFCEIQRNVVADQMTIRQALQVAQKKMTDIFDLFDL